MNVIEHPCPFCGEANHITTSFGETRKWGNAECQQCGARGPEARTGYDSEPAAPWRDAAIEAWNKRFES